VVKKSVLRRRRGDAAIVEPLISGIFYAGHPVNIVNIYGYSYVLSIIMGVCVRLGKVLKRG